VRALIRLVGLSSASSTSRGHTGSSTKARPERDPHVPEAAADTGYRFGHIVL
jgi:hypothetical protein